MKGQETEDWAAVAAAIRERTRELGLTQARLAQEAGLPVVTIRHIEHFGDKRTKSTLVALSAVLLWRHDHLVNILAGRPGMNAPALESALLEALNEKVGKLKTDLRTVELLIDKIRREHRD